MTPKGVSKSGLHSSSGICDGRLASADNVEGGGDTAKPAGKIQHQDQEAEGRKSVEVLCGEEIALYRDSDWLRDSDWQLNRDQQFQTIISDEEPWRSVDRRDYARVVHSPSFRRLQGKTQLFPGHESDFFRNRLTHSLEVGQIAEAIAYRLNHTCSYFRDRPISPRLCMTAGLMHDLGHPPFGHNGEKALDDKMLEFGGFEGNAQTFRIATRLEKKTSRQGADWLTGFLGTEDGRTGLGLCYRSIASILKYDCEIPHVREERASLVKGYYADDADVVKRVKEAVAPGLPLDRPFKTLECSLPIRLTQTPTKCGVHPIAGVKLGVGW